MNPQTKNCQNCKNCNQDFVIETSDFSFYEKIKVPPPTFCPECRLQRRLASYNIRTLYKRNCSKCEKSMISVYPPESESKAYCTQCYFSDDWDSTEYARDYDFFRPFFEQFAELRKDVPQLHIRHSNNNGEGCEYFNSGSNSSYVYLSYGVVGSEHIYYGYLINKGNRMLFDCLNVKKNELGYELVNSNGNFQSIYLTDSNQCVDSSFLFNSLNCQNCFMSSNLRNKMYCFRNEQLSKEDYDKKISEINFGNADSFKLLIEEYDALLKSSIHCYATIIKSENCTGDMIENCDNVKYSFNVWGCQNMKYCAFLMNLNADSYDLTVSGRGERTYELVTSGGGGGNFDTKFCHRSQGAHNVEYSDTCRGCSDCFGCVSLNKKQYCILNKQYTKEEYFEMVEKIKKHMKEMPFIDKKGRVYSYGEYFPIEISQSAYNETLAIEQFPLSKSEALEKGYKWRDEENKNYTTTLNAVDIPKDIKDVNESVLNEIILCEHAGNCTHQCTKGYRIIQEELSFYKRMKLPIPTMCPNCRYHERLKRRNPWKLWHRTCMCNQDSHSHKGNCREEFETSYSPERSEIIYCKKCYQKEVY